MRSKRRGTSKPLRYTTTSCIFILTPNIKESSMLCMRMQLKSSPIKQQNNFKMDYKKVKTDTTAVTRDKHRFYDQTGNIYKSVAVLSKRANQIGLEMKEELNRKIAEFA